MLTLTEIRTALADRRLSVVAKATGIHVTTIARIRDGVSLDPKSSVVAALSAYLEARK
jgi:predicted transcriptional regulator